MVKKEMKRQDNKEYVPLFVSVLCLGLNIEDIFVQPICCCIVWLWHARRCSIVCENI